MEKALVSSNKKSLTVTGLASFAPVLALLGSERLPVHTIAVLQLLTIFLIQFLANFFKIGRASGSSSKGDKLVTEPVKVEVVNGQEGGDGVGETKGRRRGAEEDEILAELDSASAPSPASVPVKRKRRERPLREGRSHHHHHHQQHYTANKTRVLEGDEPVVSPVDLLPGGPSSSSSSAGLLVTEVDQSPILKPSSILQHDTVPRAPPTRIIEEHPLYSNEELDACLRHFLAVLEPVQLARMTDAPDPASLPSPLPLSEWEQMLQTPNCRVAKHPVIPHLYSISAAYPDVPIRNLWELLIDITNRPKWDSMCSAAEEMETIGSDQSQGATRQASVTYMATKGMFPVKANDMVLLSVNARLASDDGCKRLVCATTSVNHPSKPVTRSYSRLSLNISGFLAEEDGTGGSRVTQLTDLSALGSWVPTRIIKMVTETMIPKSLEKIAVAARDHQLDGPRGLLRGDAWLPPYIGSWEVQALPSPASTLIEVQEPDHVDTRAQSPSQSSETLRDSSNEVSDEQSDDQSEEEPDHLPASTSRDIHELVLQLRNVNNRLAQLEGTVIPSTGSPSVAEKSSFPGTPSNVYADGTAYKPPPPPFGLNKVTENALSPQMTGGPLGWMGRIASTLSFRGFLNGLGAGIFSTTTAATLAAVLVYYFRWRKR